MSSQNTSLLFEAAPMGVSDVPLGSSSSTAAPASAAVSGSIQSAQQPTGSIAPPPQQQQQQSILQQSSHPVVLIFHLLFKLLALLVYIFGPSWPFSFGFIFTFVIVVLLLAFDFWTVKNVTGRLLVGLRWWNEIKDDGTNVWIFESRENRIVNAVDSRIFWTALYASPAIWVLFGVAALARFMFSWLVVVVVALVLNMANVVGYTKCEKDARQKLTNYIASNSMIQGFVGNFISERISGLFGGSSSSSASRV